MSDTPEQPEVKHVETNGGLKQLLTSSILTAALTVGGMTGVQYVGVTPAPAPPAPLPTPYTPDGPLSGFGARVVEAFAADGGSKQEASERGDFFLSLSRAIELDGQEDQPALRTIKDLASVSLRMYRLSETQQPGQNVRAVVGEAINKLAGPLDEAKRAALVGTYREAGEALKKHGGG